MYNSKYALGSRQRGLFEPTLRLQVCCIFYSALGIRLEVGTDFE